MNYILKLHEDNTTVEREMEGGNGRWERGAKEGEWRNRFVIHIPPNNEIIDIILAFTRHKLIDIIWLIWFIIYH